MISRLRYTLSAFCLLCILFAAAVYSPHTSADSTQYFPPTDIWEHRNPEAAGMNSAHLLEAIDYAKTQASRIPPDFSTQVETFGAVLGPLPKERGESNGIILRHGYIVAQWGDTKRVDPTYSVAKSFLSIICGLAVDRGLIKSVNDPVRNYVSQTDHGYDLPHNAPITWQEHLQQTSEWQGSLWGKESDFIGVKEFGRGRRELRDIREPGTYWEYNDVRINRLSLSLLRVWNRSLPDVLKTEIMDKIGASKTWQYHGYPNSQVEINGRTVESVSGGTRWGGGLWINSWDMARFGYLLLRKGNWNGKQLISKDWIEAATKPAEVGPDYGYLFWLNTKRKQWASAPESSFAALGYGSNIIFVDPKDDIVIVWRWYEDKSANEFIGKVLGAING